ncbi:MAG: MATE family efflux transporter [Proteobacteria bacterium]|nr:MATE family efflux transporter [Pseudomonadota bacterium]
MSQNNLTQGPVTTALFKLTAPMMMGVSSSILVQALEIGFIGQLGTEAVAAVTFTFPITMILSSIALGIGIGTSSVIARSVGAGDKGDVQQLGTHSLILVSSLMVVLGFVGWATIDPVFKALGAPDQSLGLIRSYLNIYYPGAVLFTTTMITSSIMRANGNANVPGVVMTVGALLNLALDPILIFGWFGFPRMELAGAATAMTVTRVITTVVLLFYVLRADLIVLQAAWNRFAESTRRIMTIGIPAMATQLIGPVSAAIITRLLANSGEAVVAGFGVAIRIESVAVMLLFALSGSIGPFVGQNWGARRPDRVHDGLKVTYLVCLAWGLLAALPMILFGETIARWVDVNPEVVSVASIYLAIVPWSYGLWGVLMMASASFNALGRPIPSTVLSFTRMFIVYVPIAMLLNEAMSYKGVFIASALTNALMGAVAYLWFRRSFEASHNA